MPDKVLVDTSVWIEFFRKKGAVVSSRLREILNVGQACYLGPIAVELYQGAKTRKEIQIVDQLLENIHYVEMTRAHYHHAGIISRELARQGKTFSTIDMIIAVVALDEQLALFTLDSHFQEISKHCQLLLITL